MGNQLGSDNADVNDPLYKYRLQRQGMGLQTDQTDSNVEAGADYQNWLKTGQTGQAGSAPSSAPSAAPAAMPESVGAMMPGVGEDVAKSGAPPSVAGIMSATATPEQTPQFLGAQSGALRPLGQRLGIADSTVLASLGRRPY